MDEMIQWKVHNKRHVMMGGSIVGDVKFDHLVKAITVVLE